MKLFFLFTLLSCSLVASLTLDDSIVFYSSQTPENLLSYFSNSRNCFDLDTETAESLSTALKDLDFSFFVDLSNLFSSFIILNKLSEEFQVVYLTTSEYETRHENRIEIHCPQKAEEASLVNLFKYLEPDKVWVLSSANDKDLNLAFDLKNFLLDSEILTYSEKVTNKVADVLIKSIKSKPGKYITLIDNSESLKVIEDSIINKKLIKIGKVLVYSKESFPSYAFENSLKIAEIGTESSKNLAEFHFLALSSTISQLSNVLDSHQMPANKFNIKHFLSTKKCGPESFALLVTKNQQTFVAGYFTENSLNITTPFEDSNKVTTTKTKITISIANGPHETFNLTSYAVVPYLYQGSLLAAKHINEQNLIPGFEVNLLTTDCGFLLYDPAWFKACFEKLFDQLGVAHITNLFGMGINGNIETLNGLGKKMPHISPSGGSEFLENKAAYPELLMLHTKLSWLLATQLILLKNLGYSQMIILSAKDDAQSYEIYLDYMKTIEAYGIKVVNDESIRFLPYSYNRSSFAEYQWLFKELRKKKCNFFFITVQPFLPFVLEALYDVGFREGQFVYIAENPFIRLLDGLEEPYYTKRKELLQGGLLLAYREWIGDFGKSIKQELLTMFPEVSIMCMTYDAVFVIKEAINYLIAAGEDFEEYEKLVNAMRYNKVYGCLGKIQFERDGNSRFEAQLVLRQIYFNKTLQALSIEDIAYIDRFGANFFTQINEFVWPTDEAPVNIRPTERCDYEDYTISNSKESKKILYIICAILCITAAIAAGLGFYKLKIPFCMLENPQIASLNDKIFVAYYWVEIFQWISMGPSQRTYKKLFNNAQILLSLDLIAYFSFNNEKFWIIFWIVFGMICCWCILSVLVISNLTIRLQNFSAFNMINLVSEYFLPLFGHFLFLPSVSMLLNLFLCSEKIGDDLTDSYMDRDCLTFCYTGGHKLAAIFTSLVLFIFVFVGVLFRPLWELRITDLHLKTRSKYLFVLSLAQVLAAVLNKTLKNENQDILGGLMCGLIMCLLIFTYIYKPYNYKRADITHVFTLSIALWNIFFATVFRESNNYVGWLVCDIAGTIIIIIIWRVFYIKNKIILYDLEPKSIVNLFLFQFCKNYEKFLTIIQQESTQNIENKYIVSEAKPDLSLGK